MKIKDQSIAAHRARAKDNLLWFIIVGILIAVYVCSGCSTQRSGCQLTRGYVGYGSR